MKLSAAALEKNPVGLYKSNAQASQDLSTSIRDLVEPVLAIDEAKDNVAYAKGRIDSCYLRHTLFFGLSRSQLLKKYYFCVLRLHFLPPLWSIDLRQIQPLVKILP